ncbi:hypothetical protein [Burkholderia sp. THE68]|uniref:hypothetical protein n=1 Tax=Burkholderia sp. THE68 TaxID=758782 RepID=UPI001389A427|nr:hypothetical protein [Burkholderia sp. THE68]
MRATTLLSNLLEAHPLYLSQTIDHGTFFWWLSNDCPDFFRELKEVNADAHFSRRLGRFLTIARSLFEFPNGSLMWSNHASIPTSRWPCMAEDIENLLRIAFPRWSVDARRDAVDDTALLCDLFNARFPKKEGVVEAPAVFRSYIAATDSSLQFARKQASSCPDTAFIAPTSALADDILRLVAEKYCFVVPLKAKFDEAWRLHSTDGAMRFDFLAFTSDAANELRAMLSLDDGRVRIDFESVIEPWLHHFRTELPIVYATEGSSVLVRYPIQPFALRQRFHSAQTEFDLSWNDCSESFETRLDMLDRYKLPKHFYVCRNVISLPGTGTNDKPEVLPHWTSPASERAPAKLFAVNGI